MNAQQTNETNPENASSGTYYQFLEISVRELLIEKGVLSEDDIRIAVEEMDSRGPERGAQVVARAWVDPQFKQSLLQDAPSAVKTLGLDIGPLQLLVVENTPDVHNLIVCTLCSCYPRTLLGLPPDWYKSREYRSRAVREPRSVLREFGTEIPDEVEVRVHDSTADLRYLVLPQRPTGTGHLTEDELSALVERDSMIGVTVVLETGF
ncbi:MAG: nitrile hydratase subunit alpha [SAR324 cluster bacterium]|jgi:nitrile hydratase|nr:nitrile hydratase subunit alpha [SAR324 cluster bacterium]